MKLRFLLLPLLLALLLPALAPAQQIHIYVGAPGKNKIPVALPLPVGSSAAANEFYEVIRRDLELSGWVEVIDAASYIEPRGVSVRPGEFRFADWKITGAVGLAKTKLEVSSELRAEVWVYDIGGEQKLGAKAFKTEPKNLRIIAHKVANEIIYRLTGREATFNTRFAFAGKFSGNKEIYMMDFDGENRRPITKNGAINIQPSWSPDGKKIAFTSYLNGNPDLYVADLIAAKIKRISSRKGLNMGAAWNPDGGSIALTLAPKGDPDLYLIDSLSGEKIAQLTKSYGIDTSATFSPDGKRIAFVSERSGGAQIYTMNSDGSNPKRLTFEGKHNTDPVWSPDGSKITYVSRDKNFDVHVVNIDGKGHKQITSNMGDNEDPSWSPDGNFIAFSSTRTGSPHLWMATLDGEHQIQLSRGRGGYTNPSWSPPFDW